MLPLQEVHKALMTAYVETERISVIHTIYYDEHDLFRSEDYQPKSLSTNIPLNNVKIIPVLLLGILLSINPLRIPY